MAMAMASAESVLRRLRRIIVITLLVPRRGGAP
jgi:hypothetical protein